MTVNDIKVAFEEAVLVFLCWRQCLLRSDLTHMPEMKVQHIFLWNTTRVDVVRNIHKRNGEVMQ